MNTRSQSEQMTEGQSSASASSTSEESFNICTIENDNTTKIFITVGMKDKKQLQESMLTTLRLNHLLSSSPASDSFPTQEDAKFIVDNPYINLRTSAPGLFKNVQSITKAASDLLNLKTLPLFSDTKPEWKYNKSICTAWIIQESEEILNILTAYFIQAGIDTKHIELAKTKVDEASMPILVVKSLTLEVLEKLHPAVAAPKMTKT